jgi:hypothetical protein
MNKTSTLCWIAVLAVGLAANLDRVHAGLLDDFSTVNPVSHAETVVPNGNVTFSTPTTSSWQTQFGGATPHGPPVGSATVVDALSAYNRTTSVTVSQLPNTNSSLAIGINLHAADQVPPSASTLSYEPDNGAKSSYATGLTLTYDSFAGGFLDLSTAKSIIASVELDGGDLRLGDVTLSDGSTTRTVSENGVKFKVDKDSFNAQGFALSDFSGVNLGNITSITIAFDLTSAAQDFFIGGISASTDAPPPPVGTGSSSGVTPEPASVAIWGLAGLLGLGLFKRTGLIGLKLPENR